jgi:hypothetical protein
MKDTIEFIECRTADDFLDALHPTRGDWPENAGGWFFRGHGDSRWKLLPSAFRAPSWRDGFVVPGVDPTATKDVDSWERLILKGFYSMLDLAGQHVPRGDDLFKLLPTTFGTDSLWPDPVIEPLLALAQHHGVPTRLLDWTRSRKVAAYFAAIDALEKKTESLSVWALNQLFVDVYGDSLNDLTCHIVRPLRYGNPNLHAQAGLFTLCRGDVRDDEDGSFITLDVLLTTLARGVSAPDDMLPCLRCFRLPSSQARALLLDLRNDQIGAVSLFPGYVGVVRALREQRWFLPQIREEPEQLIPAPSDTRQAGRKVLQSPKGRSTRRRKVSKVEASGHKQAPGKARKASSSSRRSGPRGIRPR